MSSRQFRALQIVSGLLQAVVERAEGIGELDRWTIRSPSGVTIAECTIAEALDIANEALEPDAATVAKSDFNRVTASNINGE